MGRGVPHREFLEDPAIPGGGEASAESAFQRKLRGWGREGGGDSTSYVRGIPGGERGQKRFNKKP
jgi:hypothetical protein